MEEILTTADFAARKHQHQQRKGNGASYIVHPLGVAMILMDEGDIKDIATLQAAILHDTIEDTQTTYDELYIHFGKEVADIVMEVTDNKALSADKRKMMQVEHSLHMSKKAKMVKLADKIYNLRDLFNVPPKGWDEFRIRGYFVWCRKVAEGLHGVNLELDAIFDRLMDSVLPSGTPVIPENPEEFLHQYYVMMSKQSSANTN